MTVNSKAAKRAARKDKFKYEFELDENQIGMKLEHYLGLLEAGLGGEFELESSIEAATGADYEYQGIQARYYLQAKAPIALISANAVPIASGKEGEGFNAIRSFRRDSGLADDPYSLCFGLRKPAKHAVVPDELQHNLLYAMNDPGNNSHSMYVAPTTYSKDEYLKLLRDSSHWKMLQDGPFWHFRHTRRRLVMPTQLAADVMINMPFLQAHICITPHEKVTTHHHHYSYSIHANDVAFHSPTVLEGVSSNLSDFLASQVRQIERFETQSIESVFEALKRSLPESLGRELAPSEGQSALAGIRRFGKILREQHGIIQYLVTKRQG